MHRRRSAKSTLIAKIGGLTSTPRSAIVLRTGVVFDLGGTVACAGGISLRALQAPRSSGRFRTNAARLRLRFSLLNSDLCGNVRAGDHTLASDQAIGGDIERRRSRMAWDGVPNSSAAVTDRNCDISDR